MRRFMVVLVAALGIGLSACANTPTDRVDQIAAPTTTEFLTTTAPTSAPLPTTEAVPASSIDLRSNNEASPYSLMPLFNFLGEQVFLFEAVGYDAEAEQYVVYTKSGEGGPAIELHDTLPPVRPLFELIDDGGGRVPGEQHMIIRNMHLSFDAHWSETGDINLRPLRTDADPLTVQGVQRLLAQPAGRILFVGVDSPPGEDESPILRSLWLGEDGNYALEWGVEFESQILFAFEVENDRVLVATGAPAGPAVAIDRVHLVEPSGFSRSIEAPPGLLALQQPVWSDTDTTLEPFETCGDEQIEFESIGTSGVEAWHIDTSHQLITACAGGVPISTTMWCCGMGEYFGAMDSNRDGIEEVFVGGTSVGGAGAGVYSLVDGQLAPIRIDEGDELSILDGDIGGGYFRIGCRNGSFVQVEVKVDGDKAWADRTTYRIDGHRASVTNTSRIEWVVPVETSPWRAHDMAPPEIVSDLIPCGAPDYHELAGTDGFRIHIRPHALSSAATCEVQWPRPYDPLVLTDPDGLEREWVSPNNDEISLHWIAPGDFLSTEDGRFALLDYFPCSHEGTIKSIFTGRYDPATGQLLEWRYVDPPEDYVSQRLGYQRHPDRLVIDDDGDLVGELDTGVEVLRLPLG